MSKISGEATEMKGRPTELSASEWHRLLAVERRRLVLDLLADETTPPDLETIAREMVAHESASGTTDEETIEQVKISLHHSHLPVLAELGVIDYDPGTHRIDPDTERLDVYRCL